MSIAGDSYGNGESIAIACGDSDGPWPETVRVRGGAASRLLAVAEFRL